MKNIIKGICLIFIQSFIVFSFARLGLWPSEFLKSLEYYDVFCLIFIINMPNASQIFLKEINE